MAKERGRQMTRYDCIDLALVAVVLLVIWIVAAS
jgi:hypothetical protein